MPSTNLLDDVASDLAVWIDQTATEIAVAFSATRAPFSARTTNEDKLEYYRSKLFNPDGSPNPAGRDEQLRRLGSDGFATVFKAVTQHWPELKPAEQEEISVPDEWPTVPNGGLPAPVLPSGPGGQPPPGPGPMMR